MHFQNMTLENYLNKSSITHDKLMHDVVDKGAQLSLGNTHLMTG